MSDRERSIFGTVTSPKAGPMVADGRQYKQALKPLLKDMPPEMNLAAKGRQWFFDYASMGRPHLYVPFQSVTTLPDGPNVEQAGTAQVPQAFVQYANGLKMGWSGTTPAANIDETGAFANATSGGHFRATLGGGATNNTFTMVAPGAFNVRIGETLKFYARVAFEDVSDTDFVIGLLQDPSDGTEAALDRLINQTAPSSATDVVIGGASAVVDGLVFSHRAVASGGTANSVTISPYNAASPGGSAEILTLNSNLVDEQFITFGFVVKCTSATDISLTSYVDTGTGAVLRSVFTQDDEMPFLSTTLNPMGFGFAFRSFAGTHVAARIKAACVAQNDA
jgi:hypothetical protein